MREWLLLPTYRASKCPAAPAAALPRNFCINGSQEIFHYVAGNFKNIMWNANGEYLFLFFISQLNFPSC